eukprot:TRINITY_DN1336_c0_g1_i2.p1 TRINITY_DN1336_c0_g1~~TRINITY_DN1336_c0_g1_i2.p1  ORF type:complete len:1215 (-),score=199.44 TRINITY_DN1336_c0_g1_i2:75-3719(-)
MDTLSSTNHLAKTAPDTGNYDEWFSGMSDDLIILDSTTSASIGHASGHRTSAMPNSPASDTWWGMTVDQPTVSSLDAQSAASMDPSQACGGRASQYSAYRDLIATNQSLSVHRSAYGPSITSAPVERPALVMQTGSYLASTPAYPVYPQFSPLPSQYLGVNGPPRYLSYPQPPLVSQPVDMTRNIASFSTPYRAEKVERDDRGQYFGLSTAAAGSCSLTNSSPIAPLASTGFAHIASHQSAALYQQSPVYDEYTQAMSSCTCDGSLPGAQPLRHSSTQTHTHTHSHPHAQRTFSQQQLHHHVAPASAAKRVKLDHTPTDSASSPLPLSPLSLGMLSTAPAAYVPENNVASAPPSNSWPPSLHASVPTSPPSLGQAKAVPKKEIRSPGSATTSMKGPSPTANTGQRGVKRKFDKVESLLKGLADNQVSFHVYDNSKRLFVRYRQADEWKLRDLGDIMSVNFHAESAEVRSPPMMAESGPRPLVSPVMDTSSPHTINNVFHSSATSPASDLDFPDLFNNVLHSAHPPAPFDGSLYDFPEAVRCGSGPARVTDVNTNPTPTAAKAAKRELQLDFKRKEHYWRRGIWIRVAVDVVTTDGVSVRDAGGSISVALLSVKGDTIKRSCEKCSKYYFRYKNVECEGNAPAFEIEEKERSIQVRAGRASFNIRVWECSHHFLSPHTLMFSWIEPESGNVGASCMREIVISSGSGQERKLKDMVVSRQDALQLYLEALVNMEDGLYSRAIEALRCLRWKSFHFLGPLLVPYDEKIGDCYMRMSDYNSASDCYNRAIRQLTHLKDKLSSAKLRYNMLAVLYLKQATLEYHRQRDSSTNTAFDEELPCKMLLKAISAFGKANCARPAADKEEEETRVSPRHRTSFANQGFGSASSTGGLNVSQSETEELAVVKRYLAYTYQIGLASLYLKLKSSPAATTKLVGPITTNLVRSSLHEARVALDAMFAGTAHSPSFTTTTTTSSSLSSSQLTDMLEPLLTKMHIGVDGLQKVLRSPLITNSAVVALSSDTAPTPEMLVALYNDLKETTEHTAQLHPKGHRTLFISRCLSALVSYLTGHCHRDDALRTVEDQARAMNRFWQQVSSNNAVAAAAAAAAAVATAGSSNTSVGNAAAGGICSSNNNNNNINASRFECRQMSALADYLRTAPPTSPLLASDHDTSQQQQQPQQQTHTNPLAGVFGDHEHMQLFRLWLHSPLDIVLWRHLFSFL